jgi:hypothetical protein
MTMEDALAEMAQQEEERMLMGEREYWGHPAGTAQEHSASRWQRQQEGDDEPRTPSPSPSSRTGLQQEQSGLEALLRAYEDDVDRPPLPGGPSSPRSSAGLARVGQVGAPREGTA